VAVVRGEYLLVLAHVVQAVALRDVVAERWRCSFDQPGVQLDWDDRRPVAHADLAEAPSPDVQLAEKR
jgi:hypothetical protein